MSFESEIETPRQRVIELRSWSEFEEHLHLLNSQIESDGPIDQRFEEPLFRGQGNHHCNWKLETTLERLASGENIPRALGLLAYYRRITACKAILEGLMARRWPEVPGYPEFKKALENDPTGWLDSFLNGSGVYEYLVYLRHHGFPSPLLDWTASPYIAAFFAFDQPHERAEHVCVYAFFRKGIHSGSSDQHFFVVGPYMRTDQRHYLQQCRYSMCVKMNGSDFSFISHDKSLSENNGDQGVLFELRIPVSERLAALRKLELMNINPYSLFASEDSLVRTLTRRECDSKMWDR
jgi:hypothetical protein